MSDAAGYRYVPNPNAPVIFCHHLHEVEVIGGAARFIPVTFRKVGDETIGEVPVQIILPNEAVGPALAMTWSRMPSGVIVPAVGHLMRHLVVHH